MIRFGILGAARIAPRALIHPARGRTDLAVTMVAARDPVRARAYAFEHGIPRVAHDYDSLVRHPEIDAVYVALPNSDHLRWALAALNAGKHVLVEKPVCANAREVETLIEAARGRPAQVLAEAMHYRYHPMIGSVRQRVAGGGIGTVRRIQAEFIGPLRRQDDIRYQWPLAGGALMDLGCYAVHLARSLCPLPMVVRSSRMKTMSKQVDQWFEARLEAGEVDIEVRAGFSALNLMRQRAVIEGSGARMTLSNPFIPGWFGAVRVDGRRAVERERATRRSSYAWMLDAFVSAVGGRADAVLPLTDALENMTVIDSLYQSAGLSPRSMP